MLEFGWNFVDKSGFQSKRDDGLNKLYYILKLSGGDETRLSQMDSLWTLQPDHAFIIFFLNCTLI